MGDYEFGDFIGIEQKRYGVPNEVYCYRVVSADTCSSSYRPVPFDSANRGYKSQDVAPVLLVLSDTLPGRRSTLEYVRPEDVTPWPSRQALKEHTSHD